MTKKKNDDVEAPTSTKKEKGAYVSDAVTKEIQASVKISLEIKKTFYTIQYSETRVVSENSNLKKERKLLQDVVYDEVYNQIQEVYEAASTGGG